MTEYMGTIGSPGLAIGRVYLFRPFVPNIIKTAISDKEISGNTSIVEQAFISAGSELEQLYEKHSAENQEKGEIISAHQTILEDEEISECIMRAITDEHKCAQWAVQAAYDKFIQMLMGIDDQLIRERISDMKDVHVRIQRCIENIPETTLSRLDSPCIVVTEDLFPSDAVSLDAANVLGIVTERGGPTSHTAIIAKSNGIPAILGVKDACSNFAPDQEIALDAEKGVVISGLSNEEKRVFERRLETYLKTKRIDQGYLLPNAYMKDGTRIEVKVNIGSNSPNELESAKYADGVGLFRSEFLYMENDVLPDEEFQFESYKSVLEAFGDKPVILRTLDIGGDKKLPYMELPCEENPFLGKRALRLCLERIDIFKTQLRAALRASCYGNLWIMFPMVASVDDIENTREVIDEVSAEMDGEGLTYSTDIKYGIMIEIPSVALISDHVADMVDFASIGTNDLCQYLTATDRMNPELKRYYQAYHPAMFRILNTIIREFTDRGKSISICGEAGGEPSFIIPLIGFGMRSFSMSASSIAGMKRLISHLDMDIARKAADDVLKISCAQEIEQYLKGLTASLLEK